MTVEGSTLENGGKRGVWRHRPAVFCWPPRYGRISQLNHGELGNIMGRRVRPRLFLFAVLAAGAVAWSAPSAMASDAEFCVTCKNPDQTYRCRVTGVGQRPSNALKLYCVIRTAKEGNHASCSASAATPTCAGVVKVYDYVGPKLPDEIATDPRLRKLKQRIETDQANFAKPEDESPDTLFKLGGRAVDASRKGLRNAGTAIGVVSPDDTTASTTAPAPLPSEDDSSWGQRVKQAAQSSGSAVGGLARKSYNCMLSLFRNCSGDDGAPE